MKFFHIKNFMFLELSEILVVLRILGMQEFLYYSILNTHTYSFSKSLHLCESFTDGFTEEICFLYGFFICKHNECMKNPKIVKYVLTGVSNTHHISSCSQFCSFVHMVIKYQENMKKKVQVIYLLFLL